MIIDIPNIFEGQEVTILGGGYSLKGFDFSIVRKPIIAINFSVKNRPDADICVGCDSYFFDQEAPIFKTVNVLPTDFFKTFKGYMVTDRGDQLFPGVKKIIYEGVAMTNGDRDLDWHCQSANISGFVPLALAFKLGAKKVYLLGYDGGYDKISNHYYHNPNIESNVVEAINWHYQWFKDYPVINYVNPDIFESKIECFKKINIKEYGNN